MLTSSNAQHDDACKQPAGLCCSDAARVAAAKKRVPLVIDLYLPK